MTVSAIVGTLRNGLGQLVQLLGHSETDININENGYV